MFSNLNAEVGKIMTLLKTFHEDNFTEGETKVLIVIEVGAN